MHDRRSTPDILGNIMSNGQEHKTIKQESKKETKQTPSTNTQETGSKEKATFNLPVSLLSELEDKCHEMRKLCKSKQVSKTLIVEEALRMAFAEFETKNQLSKFFLKVANNKAIK